jgi:hypothetical protein
MPPKPKKLPEDCMPKCATCAFCESKGEGGVCHRHPPQFVVEEGAVHSAFPAVAFDDWCGEYARRCNDR